MSGTARTCSVLGTSNCLSRSRRRDRHERAPIGRQVPRPEKIAYRMSTRCSANDEVAEFIQTHLKTGAVVKQSSMGGSSWSSAYLYETKNGGRFFVKIGRGPEAQGMFEGEAQGLQAMYDTQTLRIPKVLYSGQLGVGDGGQKKSAVSCIVMEHLNLRGSLSQEALGVGLAKMHLSNPVDAHAQQGKFGFSIDNTIGGTPQPNGWMDDWVDFLRERRLGHQLRLAGNARLSELGDKLLKNLHRFFEGVERASDLWSGNMSVVDGQEWAILDPATYYGHAEAEFGMSWCAGFSSAFWNGYHSIIPKAVGFEDRHKIYMLYHYLNHSNLFGGGYQRQAESLLSQLTAKL